MTLIVLVFLGGALTIVSPCILPVLPFVFARAEQPFLRSGLPMLAGMALTFAAVATLAAAGGAWAAHLNQYGRVVALVVLAVLALTLLSDRLADWIAEPFVAIVNRLSLSSEAGEHAALDRAGGRVLYRLIRQTGDIGEHTFSIVFDDDDVTAYAFTFG